MFVRGVDMDRGQALEAGAGVEAGAGAAASGITCAAGGRALAAPASTSKTWEAAGPSSSRAAAAHNDADGTDGLWASGPGQGDAERCAAPIARTSLLFDQLAAAGSTLGHVAVMVAHWSRTATNWGRIYMVGG